MTFLYITEKDKTILIETKPKEAIEYIKNNRHRKNLGIFSGNNKEEVMCVYREFAPFEYFNSIEEYEEKYKGVYIEPYFEGTPQYCYLEYSQNQLIEVILKLKMALNHHLKEKSNFTDEDLSFIPMEYAHYKIEDFIKVIEKLKEINKYKDDEIVRLHEKIQGIKNRKKIKIIVEN